MKQNWEGNFIDSTGQSGGIKIELEDGSKSKGELVLEVRSRDGSPMIYKAVVHFSETKNSVNLRARFAVDDNNRVELTSKMSKQGAGTHALSSAFGNYSTTSDDAAFPLTSGIIIIWKYGSAD